MKDPFDCNIFKHEMHIQPSRKDMWDYPDKTKCKTVINGRTIHTHYSKDDKRWIAKIEGIQDYVFGETREEALENVAMLTFETDRLSDK